MLSYLETKDFLCKLLLGERSSSNEDYDICYKPMSYRYSESDVQFTISNSELYNLYTNLSLYQCENASFYNNTSYEILVDVDSYAFRRKDTFETLVDSTNGYTYELGLPSPEYSLMLIMFLCEKRNESRINYRLFPLDRFRHSSFWHSINTEEPPTLEQILPQLIREFSLKIKANNSCSLSNFCSLATAYCFEFMLETQTYMIEYKDIESVFLRPRLIRNHSENLQLDKPPLRIYKEDVVDYYKMALSSSDPYIKYISFYHVIEYHYDEVFKSKLIMDMKNKLTHPDFSYKKDDKIYELAQFVKNRWKADSEDGQGDELESLKFVIAEYVPINDLAARITSYDADSVNYYKNNKVSFSDAPIVPWNDTSSIVTLLAKRIYFTRNSLVHSKSGKNNKRYKPYKNESELNKEIPLIQAIAELIIINSSQNL